jgi:ribonucleoside-diphosphate reductase beta chain
MPGLATANEFISRDEGLHAEFAIELYKMLDNQLSQETVDEIFKEFDHLFSGISRVYTIVVFP